MILLLNLSKLKQPECIFCGGSLPRRTPEDLQETQLVFLQGFFLMCRPIERYDSVGNPSGTL